MTETNLIFMSISVFLTGLCVIWTIRAATKISREFERLYELEKEYKRYLDNYVALSIITVPEGHEKYIYVQGDYTNWTISTVKDQSK